MRSFLQFLLCVFTLGMIGRTGSGNNAGPPAEARDVTLVVPGMY